MYSTQNDLSELAADDCLLRALHQELEPRQYSSYYQLYLLRSDSTKRTLQNDQAVQSRCLKWVRFQWPTQDLCKITSMLHLQEESELPLEQKMRAYGNLSIVYRQASECLFRVQPKGLRLCRDVCLLMLLLSIYLAALLFNYEEKGDAQAN